MTPSADASLTVSAAGTLANRGVRQFTVATGAATQVDIQLYPADNVTVATSGVVKFADTDNNLIADPGTVDGALITVVNGVGNNSYRADNVTPVNGQVTFTVNGTVAQSVIPAVYADYTTANNGLDLVANVPSDKLPKVPAEAFGIGGMTTWAPAEAAAFSQVRSSPWTWPTSRTSSTTTAVPTSPSSGRPATRSRSTPTALTTPLGWQPTRLSSPPGSVPATRWLRLVHTTPTQTRNSLWATSPTLLPLSPQP